ncbi:GTP cyclohydrolase FolE2 [Aquitalea sp. ASV11]|uniref:GTP cyclohydrolase FolE2 n=1 Tax=Aquitalea sp. ASV11 TaxID=2795103 RepID=UPI0018ED9B2D|nr:GTP cyclohydrolase FolE2 [Aquitalea sp. ASV11]
MNAALPDISLTDIAPRLSPLAWVGMQGIDLPVTVVESAYQRTLHARADVQVDLPSPQVKGIHMSRLYQLLDTLGQDEALSPASLRYLLQAMINSHQDCDTGNARLGLNMALLVQRPALVTQGLSGWKSYPVRIDASLIRDRFTCRVQVTVGYSSTCPCSAALSRQIIEHSFLAAFDQQSPVKPADVAAWLHQHATMATPHSQRSEALVAVDVTDAAETLGILALIDHIEQAVGTPVQTAVKRVDEQAFAALNGQNLMFVEDAARRIEAALTDYANPSVHVRHLESLHPHDAVAWAVPMRDGVSA